MPRVADHTSSPGEETYNALPSGTNTTYDTYIYEISFTPLGSIFYPWEIEGIIDRINTIRQPGTLSVDKITDENRVFHLKKPIAVDVTLDDDVWTFEYKPLNLFSYGLSRADAYSDLQMLFASLWDNIARENNEKLTGDAIELKNKLLDIVKQIEE